MDTSRALHTVAYLGVAVLGLMLLYAALAHPPTDRTGALWGISGETDSGVHVDEGWTIDYYYQDTLRLYDGAYTVFGAITLAGLLLFGGATRRLWKTTLNPIVSTPATDSEVNGR